MSQHQIHLKSVHELRLDASGQPSRYFIPAYQRGYRWSDTQVTQLLEDIREFTRRRNPQPEEFYCLQPLVLLEREDGSYEVVDGQQRLTTLLLVLRHFNERAAQKYQQPVYRLDYATRPGILEFLKDPTEQLANSNIDFFHIARAVHVIEEWFSRHETEVESIKNTFLNQAKLIWFQLSPEENPVAAFTRLNVGKIPLTNAELIRALLLKSGPSSPSEAQRLQIAYEWDQVEKSLQDPDVWAFLSNESGASGGRIDLLFSLVAQRQGMTHSFDAYATFNHFSERMAGAAADAFAEWLEVKKVHMLLTEWFEDRILYHLVGFLIWSGVGINELRHMASGSRKSELNERLRRRAAEVAFGCAVPDSDDERRALVRDQLERLAYPKDRVRLRSLLLLFNIATLLQHPRSNMRFHFEGLKTAKWDIEHVRSVAAAELGSYTQQVGWLRQTRSYLALAPQDSATVSLIGRIDSYLSLQARDALAGFEALYADVLSHFNERDDDEPDNSIANLALLDQETNRSYKNAVFPVKRKRVLDLDAHGVFVPHCTRNVFLKSYSPQVGHAVYWAQDDRDGYREALETTLYEFVAGDWIDG